MNDTKRRYKRGRRKRSKSYRALRFQRCEERALLATVTGGSIPDSGVPGQESATGINDSAAVVSNAAMNLGLNDAANTSTPGEGGMVFLPNSYAYELKIVDDIIIGNSVSTSGGSLLQNGGDFGPDHFTAGDSHRFDAIGPFPVSESYLTIDNRPDYYSIVPLVSLVEHFSHDTFNTTELLAAASAMGVATQGTVSFATAEQVSRTFALDPLISPSLLSEANLRSGTALQINADFGAALTVENKVRVEKFDTTGLDSVFGGPGLDSLNSSSYKTDYANEASLTPTVDGNRVSNPGHTQGTDLSHGSDRNPARTVRLELNVGLGAVANIIFTVDSSGGDEHIETIASRGSRLRIPRLVPVAPSIASLSTLVDEADSGEKDSDSTDSTRVASLETRVASSQERLDVSEEVAREELLERVARDAEHAAASDDFVWLRSANQMGSGTMGHADTPGDFIVAIDRQPVLPQTASVPQTPVFDATTIATRNGRRLQQGSPSISLAGIEPKTRLSSTLVFEYSTMETPNDWSESPQNAAVVDRKPLSTSAPQSDSETLPAKPSEQGGVDLSDSDQRSPSLRFTTAPAILIVAGMILTRNRSPEPEKRSMKRRRWIEKLS